MKKPTFNRNPITYGNGEELPMLRLKQQSSKLSEEVIHLRSLAWQKKHEATYQRNLKELNQTWQIIRDPDSGKRFEIGLVNTEQDSEDVVAEISTYTSSLSGNPENAKGFAENGAVMKEPRMRLYISSPGNGGSSFFEAEEIEHASKTGRWSETIETADGGHIEQPSPTIRAMINAVENHDIDGQRIRITALSTNSAGGPVGQAMLLGLPEGDVEHVFMKGRPMSELAIPSIIGRLVIADDLILKQIIMRSSRNDRCYDGHSMNHTIRSLPNIYNAERDVQTIAAMTEIHSHSLSKLYGLAKVYSRGETKDRPHPAAMDSIRAAQRHPKLKQTLMMGSHDFLHRKEAPMRFMSRVQDYGAQILSHSADIEVLRYPGTHNDHVYYPNVRWAAEDHSLNR